MEKIAIADLEPDALGTDSARRSLSEPLGTTDIAINQYRLVPGESLPGGLHAHMDQEEVFVVTEGEATFETMDGPVTVGEWEAIRFAPGEFQSGTNGSGSELEMIALGAPRDTKDVRIPVGCPACDHDTLRLEFSGSGLTFVCPGCGAEHVPRACPACGHADLRVTLDGTSRPVVACQECGAQFDSPPLRDRPE